MPDPLTPEALDTIQARANAATEGPWEVEDGLIYSGEFRQESALVARVRFGNAGLSDADFIAHARGDIPALVAAYRESTRRAERAELLNQVTQESFRKFGSVMAERDEARAELRRLRTENEEQRERIEAALAEVDRSSEYDAYDALRIRSAVRVALAEKECGIQNPRFDGVTCTQPPGHDHEHVSFDHPMAGQWGNDGSGAGS